MNLSFKKLSEVDCLEFIALHQNPLVRRYMPLTTDSFDEAECAEWLAAKEQMWQDAGYGPWAFFSDDQFIGWGGLQPENGEPDLGIVLKPEFWGLGKAVYDEIIRRAFNEMGFESITILLPPGRIRVKGIFRLGFQADGQVEVQGEQFKRYRLRLSNK
jgi:[ribosomal protein S5]-alanine N-acetyltransferase